MNKEIIEQAEKRGLVIYIKYNKRFIIDLESKPQEDLIDIYTGTIKAPKTYKDQDKIKEYIEKEKAKKRKKKKES